MNGAQSEGGARMHLPSAAVNVNPRKEMTAAEESRRVDAESGMFCVRVGFVNALGGNALAVCGWIHSGNSIKSRRQQHKWNGPRCGILQTGMGSCKRSFRGH